MLRRTFLKLFGGFFATIGLVKVDAVKSFFQEGDLRPSWCPKGFLPTQGQRLTIEKYPDLFTKMEIDGKKYIPLHCGYRECVLPVDKPFVPNELQKAGLWYPGDRLTILPPKEKDMIETKLIATEHMRWSNGRPIRAGFVTSFVIEKNIFEQTYGKIGETSPDRIFAHSGYEVSDFKRSAL